MIFFRPLRVITALTVLLFLSPQLRAVEYKVEQVRHLCSEAKDHDIYTSDLLKSLKYLVEGENGWVYRSTADFLTDFRENDTYSELKSFVDYLRSKGTRVVIAYLPTRGLINNKGISVNQYDFTAATRSYRKKLETLENIGIIVPDMGSLLEDPANQDYFFKRDIHWTPSGAQKTAALVAKAIKETGLIQEHPTFKVVNKPAGSYTITGSIAEGIKKVCGDQFINEFNQGYDVSAYFENDANALLSEEPEAEVLLLGTSFSALEKLNFHGFLQEELNAPVINNAMSAGGAKGSWLKYVKSGDFLSSPPKIIVWEIPGYYLLNETDLFAQLRPMLEQTCSDKNLLLSKQVKLEKSGKPHDTLFFTRDLLDVPLPEITLELQISDPAINTIHLKVWYSDGKAKKQSIKVPSRAKLNGHFVFSLFGKLADYHNDVIAMELIKVENQPINEYLESHDRNELDVDVKVYRMRL